MTSLGGASGLTEAVFAEGFVLTSSAELRLELTASGVVPVAMDLEEVAPSWSSIITAVFEAASAMFP